MAAQFPRRGRRRRKGRVGGMVDESSELLEGDSMIVDEDDD